MSTYTDIYVQHEDSAFKHHLSIEERLNDGSGFWGHKNTLCGIDLESLRTPVGIDPTSDPDTYDPNWYYEHERDDVIGCIDCLFEFVERFGK